MAEGSRTNGESRVDLGGVGAPSYSWLIPSPEGQWQYPSVCVPSIIPRPRLSCRNATHLIPHSLEGDMAETS